MNRRPQILYVDNDRSSSEFFRRWIEREVNGCRLVSVDSAAEAVRQIAEGGFDLYVLEYCLGDMTGPELCRQIRREDGVTPLVVCSALAREIDRNTALSSGATDYIVKPDDLDKLARLLARVFGGSPRRRRFHSLRRCSSII